jgi:hypothetical protein
MPPPFFFSGWSWCMSHVSLRSDFFLPRGSSQVHVLWRKLFRLVCELPFADGASLGTYSIRQVNLFVYEPAVLLLLLAACP